MISDRTKKALAAAKRRGVELGGDRGGRSTAKARKAGGEAMSARPTHGRLISPRSLRSYRRAALSHCGLSRRV
jgi:DNA invertase Pin-like site-specific DNA recombinase